jgi:hypothetical protein
MKQHPAYKDFIRQENELTKLKIKAEFGINLLEESELDPAVENIWLKQILEFERAMANNQKTTVGKLLKEPSFIPSSELTEDEVLVELQRLMELLHGHKIVIDSVSGVADREMYRFITEELFNKEIDSCLPDNMIVCFIYEEFHPNEEFDLKRMCAEVFNLLAEYNQTVIDTHFRSSKDEFQETRIENALRKIRQFNEAFDEVVVEECDFLSVNINDTVAEIPFSYRLQLRLSGNPEYQTLTGKGKFFCIKDLGYWFIRNINIENIV